MYSLPKNVYRERIDFSKIKTTVPIPNLIEIQKKSYERFLQMNRLPSEREDAGLQSVFKSVFPISDFRENSSLEFIEYSIGNWECKCGKLQGLHHLRKPCAGCGNVLIADPYGDREVLCPRCWHSFTSNGGSPRKKLTNSSRALPLWLEIGKIEENAACRPWVRRASGAMPAWRNSV